MWLIVPYRLLVFSSCSPLPPPHIVEAAFSFVGEETEGKKFFCVVLFACSNRRKSNVTFFIVYVTPLSSWLSLHRK